MSIRAFWAALAAAVCWALTGIFVRQLQAMPLGALLWQRFALSLALLLPLTLGRVDRGGAAGAAGSGVPVPVARRRQWWADAGLASCMSVYYICATIGFALGPVAMTSLIIALTPAVTLAWQLAVSRRAAPRELVGFAVALSGVGCYLAPLLAATVGFTHAAVLAAAVAASVATLTRAVYTILLWNRAHSGTPLHAGRVNRMTFSLATMALLPVFVVQVDRVSWSWGQVGALTALVLVATIAPNLLNTWASSRLAPTTNAIIGMLTPPVAGLLGWRLLDESLTGIQWAGMALALVGVAVSTLQPSGAARTDDRSAASGRGRTSI